MQYVLEHVCVYVRVYVCVTYTQAAYSQEGCSHMG